MQHNVKSRQAGVSFFGLVFVLAVLASVGVLGAQAFPTVLEYQAALKALEKAKAGSSPQEVRAIFDKAAQIDDITSISGKDLEVGKQGDRVVVSFNYTREMPLMGPAYLVMKYAGSSE